MPAPRAGSIRMNVVPGQEVTAAERFFAGGPELDTKTSFLAAWPAHVRLMEEANRWLNALPLEERQRALNAGFRRFNEAWNNLVTNVWAATTRGLDNNRLVQLDGNQGQQGGSGGVMPNPGLGALPVLLILGVVFIGAAAQVVALYVLTRNVTDFLERRQWYMDYRDSWIRTRPNDPLPPPPAQPPIVDIEVGPGAAAVGSLGLVAAFGVLAFFLFGRSR